MRGFVRFLKYNNAVPIAVSFLLLGAASTYAATNPGVVIDKQEEIISIDNTYIANVNFKKYSPSIKILSVTEDSETYFITYEFSTISLVEYVWRDVTTTEVLEVEKERLGEHRDLGLFVTEELNEKIKNEEKRLAETQVFEKKKISSKKVATKYKGIVGGFLSEDVSTLEKYKPVVKQPKPEKEVQTFARPDPNAKVKPIPKPVVKPTEEEPEEEEGVEEEVVDEGETEAVENTETAATSTEETGPEGNNSGGGGEDEISNDAPTLTILGENPVRVAIGETYTDLGAAVTDDHDTALTVDVYVDGEPVDTVVLDTSTSTMYSIVYESFDSEGKLAQEERVVEVYDPIEENTGNTGGGGGGSSENTEEETGTTTEEVLVNEPAATSTEETGVNIGESGIEDGGDSVEDNPAVDEEVEEDEGSSGQEQSAENPEPETPEAGSSQTASTT